MEAPSVNSLNTNGATALVVSPDRTILGSPSGRPSLRPVALYATADWSLIRVPDGIASSEWDTPRGLAFASHGKRLAFISGRDVLVVDTEKGILVQYISTQNAAMEAVFSADGSMIAASARSVRVFRVADGEQVASYLSKGLYGLTGSTWTSPCVP